MRKLKIKTIILISSVVFIVFTACVEEIDLQSETNFEDILVVEATITNEFKQQQVNLSRSFRLESNGPVLESGAEVKVVGSDNSEFIFQESQAGKYLSIEAFSALPNVEYKIQIISNNGNLYESSNEVLSGESIINNLTFEIGLNENNESGISVFVEPGNTLVSSEFYRYTFEETYKVIAPLYSPQELIPLITTNDFPFTIATVFEGFTTLTEIIDYLVDIQLREEDVKVCYNTVLSNEIILANTNNFNDNHLDRKRIRFLNKDNYIISHRYSILVRQFGQSQEAHSFYSILKDLSENDNLFSALQPGFFSGNVFAINNSNEKVAGFFEVSSVDEKRIYFNYTDVFPEEDLPPYIVECDDLLTPVLLVTDGDGHAVSSPLINDLDDGKQLYVLSGYSDNDSPFDTSPFVLVLEGCGKCTLYGSTELPEFWEE